MSRLIVKNLPKDTCENKLRTLFSQKGEVTDVQLKYTTDGKFRHFGFVGYRTEEQAISAKNYFHGTCINANPIVVELCVGLGDPNKPKAWSKYASDSKAYKNNHDADVTFSAFTETNQIENEKDINKLLEKHKNDPLFEEYLQVHLRNDKSQWNNDIPIESDLNKNKTDIDSQQQNENTLDKLQIDNLEKDKETIKLANKNISDLEYMKSLIVNKDDLKISKTNPFDEKETYFKLFTIKVKGLPYSCKKKDLKHFFHPLVPFTIRLPQKLKGFAYVGFKNEKDMNKSLVKNKSFLLGRQISIIKYEQKMEKEQNNINDNNKINRWREQEDLLKKEECIAESGKIFIRNLTYTTTENEIQSLFEKFGPLVEVNLPIDKTTRLIKGFGVVSFLMPEHATKAYSELDGTILNGRMLHLLPAKSKEDDIDTSDSNYKQKKVLKQKSQAGLAHNWNTLFVGHDAVANTVAETYGTTKANVLGADINENAKSKGVSAAVRLALGESQIVQNIKKFLENNDVCLEVFNEPTKKRSKTVLIVKNLPANTTLQEIVKLFKPFGILGRVVLPPSGITALVEFIEPFEARNAFKKLAYSKFKNLPLYLEWAPENSFKTSSGKLKIENEHLNNELYCNDKKDKEAVSKEDLSTNTEININENEEPEPNTTLFVKNLNFKTTEESLRKHFEKCGKVNYAMVATKKDPNNVGEKLSLGFGFVRFWYEANAEEALKTLNFTSLDGKTLDLKRSERTLQSDVNINRKIRKPQKQIGTKILVKNIPFQANKNEIMDLFKTFGEIRALRLPKKLNDNSSHRGFAFIDYQTKSDAKQAFEALSQSTHLYGRRLVLEWAENDTEDISILQKRTANFFNTKENSKKIKKSVFDIDNSGI